MNRLNIALLGFVLIIGFFLVTEHWAHVYGYLPYILLLACPLLHILGHGGHGSHGDDTEENLRSSSHHHHD